MPVKFEHEPKEVPGSTKTGPPMTGTRIKFGSAINAGSKNTQQDILLASVFSRILDMTECQKEDVAAAAAAAAAATAAAAAATSVAAPAAIAAPEEASPSREDPDAAAPSSDATVAAPAPNDQGVTAAAAAEEAPPAARDARDAPAATVPVAPAAAGPQADEFEAMYCGDGHGDFGRAVGDFCLRVYKETKYHT